MSGDERRAADGPDGSPDPGPPSQHQPSRPTWRCAACHEDWPCPRRREELSAEFARDRVTLSLYLARHLSEALADRPDALESALYQRFLGWYPHRGQ